MRFIKRALIAIAIGVSIAVLTPDQSSAAAHLSVSRARHAIQRFERAYWRSYPVKLHFGACERDNATGVTCDVTVTGVFADLVFTEADGTTTEVAGPSQSITLADHARLRRGRVKVSFYVN